jgi:hypothetical protein
MSIWLGVATIFGFFWSLFVTWLSIFIAPIKNPEMLWIIIPIWISWFFSEFFQEKLGTDYGNAISNGAVVLWVGIDWARYMFRLLEEGKLFFGWEFGIKLGLALICFAYGLIIIIAGIRTRKVVAFIGRIRDVTYVLVMFSPIIYDVIPLEWKPILAMIIFFPVFYIIIEIIDQNTPDPQTYAAASRLNNPNSASKIYANSNTMQPNTNINSGPIPSMGASNKPLIRQPGALQGEKPQQRQFNTQQRK